MTTLQIAFTEAQKLPQAEQERFAEWIIAELHAEQTWDDLFSSSQKKLQTLAHQAHHEKQQQQTVTMDDFLKE